MNHRGSGHGFELALLTRSLAATRRALPSMSLILPADSRILTNGLTSCLTVRDSWFPPVCDAKRAT